MPRAALDKAPRISGMETKNKERRRDADGSAVDAKPTERDAPPTTRRNLKRTASTASLLLTPPRTVKREKRRHGVGRHVKRSVSRTPSTLSARSVRSTRSVRSGKSTYISSDDEDEGEECGEEDNENADNVSLRSGSSFGRRLDFGRKKRRVEVDSRLDALLDAISGEETDNPFCEPSTKPVSSAEASSTKSSTTRVREEERVDSHEEKSIEKVKGTDEKNDDGKEDTDQEENEFGESDDTRKSERPDLRSPSPLLLRYKVKAPVSPPPSNRKRPVVEVEEQPDEDEPLQLPSTPKGKKRKSLTVVSPPARDTPNNPFLEDDESPLSVTDEPTEPQTPTAQSEKATITYVFRGVRATFANPMYELPPEVHERSLLPVEHPDYSPDPACPPKLLFADAHKTGRRRDSPSPTRMNTRLTTKGKAADRKGKDEDEDEEVDGFDRAIEPSTPKKSKVIDEWEESDDEDAVLRITPPKRLFV